MDIVDVVLARVLSSRGQIETYAALAQKAVTDAKKAVDDIDSITEQTNTNNELAQETIGDLNAALEALAQADIPTMTEVTEKICDLDFALSTNTASNTITKNLVIYYPDNTSKTLSGVVKYYTSAGVNTDGTMTQKAITDAIAAGGGGGGGGSVNYGPENVGQLVSIDNEGFGIASGLLADDLAEFFLKNDISSVAGTVGLKLDYSNNTYMRTQDAVHYVQGQDFDQYAMYGGRMRCNVADDGTINAFYGQSGYKEDGSNGQVMVYQPKFYYSRIPTDLEGNNIGYKIRKEIITLSPDYKPGFKIHPAFINDDGQEIDYILYSAYEGSAYLTDQNAYDSDDSSNINFSKDKLSSISSVRPISGRNKEFTRTSAEQMANNRGTGWHIDNMVTLSANQMLEMIELGYLNTQHAVESGVVNLNDNSNASVTGSTSALGNSTGYAPEGTINISNSGTTTYNENGKRAISYRGIENPWGNIWKFITRAAVIGNGQQAGGVIRVCNNYTYSSTEVYTYPSTDISITNTKGYASSFGYNNNEFDYIFIPNEANGNTSAPIGDKIWVYSSLNGDRMITNGGCFSSQQDAGAFAYAYSESSTTHSERFGARLVYIPTKNSIHTANVQKWKLMRGE